MWSVVGNQAFQSTRSLRCWCQDRVLRLNAQLVPQQMVRWKSNMVAHARADGILPSQKRSSGRHPPFQTRFTSASMASVLEATLKEILMSIQCKAITARSNSVEQAQRAECALAANRGTGSLAKIVELVLTSLKITLFICSLRCSVCVIFQCSSI